MTDPGGEADDQPAPRGITGAAMVVLALAAVGVALYLTWAKLAGAPVVCGPLQGCETVETSPYAAFLGIPVAAFGAGASVLTLIGALAWWRRANRYGLLAAYGLGLASLPILGYLAYLEVAVIHAICVWCVTYALLTLGCWLLSVRAMRR